MARAQVAQGALSMEFIDAAMHRPWMMWISLDGKSWNMLEHPKSQSRAILEYPLVMTNSLLLKMAIYRYL